MANEEMMSCILCLEAFERSTMLEVALRHGGGGEVPSHIICMKCGAAIAAEYLYRERAQRPQAPAAEPSSSEPETTNPTTTAPEETPAYTTRCTPTEGDT
jgi:hypothetical protein